MEPISLAVFVLIAAVASYIQTITGFAFGLIMVGAVTGLNLAPIEFTAVVVGFCSLISALIALRGAKHGIQWSIAWPVLIGLAPALLGGLLLLGLLSQNATAYLRLLLGVTILAGGVFLMLKPSPYEKSSASWSYALVGGIGGLFGGLFSVSGPPIVYHLYRQPIALVQIKTTLLMIFGGATLARIVLVGVQGGINSHILITSALAMPVVIGATVLGKRFPPSLSDQALRRGAFLLLSAMGIVLIITS